jgi:hypothetical protein
MQLVSYVQIVSKNLLIGIINIKCPLAVAEDVVIVATTRHGKKIRIVNTMP